MPMVLLFFDQPQYMLLNLALGANGGDPSATQFPINYEVDYFRVYQKTVDLEKPTVVTNIVASNISNSSCTLSWDASADNVGVVAYHIYNNGRDAGAYIGTSTSTTFTLNGLRPGANNRIYVRALDAVGNYSDFQPAPLVVKTVPSLTGTVISDMGGSWNDDPNTDAAKAFDNNPATFYDSKNANAAWVGLDLGKTHKIEKIRFAPRSTHYGRMTGGKFQASNVADFSAGVVDLYAIANPLAAGTWGEALVDHSSAYRYVRYLSPDNGFCNVAEIEFYGTAMDISGVSETLGLSFEIYPNPVSDYAYFQTNAAMVDVDLTLMNMAGQMVLKSQTKLLDGHKLDLSSVASGLYVLTISNVQHNISKRLYKK